MTRLIFAIILVTVALVACTAASNAPALTLGPAPWQDGDKLTYDWVDKSGAKLGVSEAGFAKNGDAWVLSVSDRLTGLDQTAQLRLDAQTLKPLGGEKTIKAQGTDAKVSTAYQDSKLTVKAVVNGEDKSAGTDVPANALDNDQILQTLRALPFAEGYSGQYVNVNAQNVTKISAVATVKGKESIQVPAGSYEAWRVELDFGQAKQYAWYQVVTPHLLVMYDNGTNKKVLVK